jgi:hypothetical protein
MCWNLMNTANVGCKRLTNMKLQLKPIHTYFEGRKAIDVGQFVTERPLWHWKFENCVGHPSRVTSTINRIIKEKTLSPFCICVFPGLLPYKGIHTLLTSRQEESKKRKSYCKCNSNKKAKFNYV